MTDTVNVPREVLERLVAWINREVPVPTRSATRWAMDITDLLAAAPKAEPVDVELYLQEAISSSPQPLQDLGEFLSSVLDEDHWKTADKLLLAIATSQPEAPKVEQEPVAWRYRSAERPHLGWTKPEYSRRSPYGRIGMDEQPLRAHPAPASDELLEAASLISRLLSNSVAHYGNPKDEDFGVGATHKEAREFLAKHKGPQS